MDQSYTHKKKYPITFLAGVHQWSHKEKLVSVHVKYQTKEVQSRALIICINEKNAEGTSSFYKIRHNSDWCIKEKVTLTLLFNDWNLYILIIAAFLHSDNPSNSDEFFWQVMPENNH